MVGTVEVAGPRETEAAVQAARRAFPAWRDAPARERAGVLFKAAEIMRGELAELAALETLEAGKTIREADADVAEAIDFLEYYGREMLRLDAPRRMGRAARRAQPLQLRAARRGGRDRPLELPAGHPHRHDERRPGRRQRRGGQAGRADAGDRRAAGPHPAGRRRAPRHRQPAARPRRRDRRGARRATPTSHLIAFTGSRDVGLRIMARAVEHPGRAWIKRVIAEIGGKNAIIVDADADLDVAVLETVASAFGYQGQKCSACSRVIVLEPAYDEFLERLVEATRSLVVGPPDDPATRVGPVITAEARATIEGYIEQGRREATLALATARAGRRLARRRLLRRPAHLRRRRPRAPSSPRRRSSVPCWPS